METLSKNRIRKHVMLSETTIEYINQWSQMNNVPFSRALEGLALMSIRDKRMLGVAEILQDTIRRTMDAQFNRFAKLIASTALEAGAGKEASQSVFWLLLLQEFERYFEELKPNEKPTLKDFEGMFSVDPNSAEGKILIGVFNSRKDRFRYRAVKQLRRPIGELMDVLEGEESTE